MEIRGKVAIITGGASGIGVGLAKNFMSEGALGIVLADVNFAQADAVAQSMGPQVMAVRCDVSIESDIQALVAAARQRFGRVDIYMSNAGIIGKDGGLELDNPLWEKMWQIHGMAHVWAARAVVPQMVAQGEGYFVVTASAAGLLSIVESAPYAVTKHASVAFAEWLRIAYGRQGVRVSCLCPQAVQTPMIPEGGGSAGVNGVLSTEQVAQAVVDVMREETFLVLPHAEVLDYYRAKGAGYDRWLGGMQKLYGKYQESLSR